MGSVHIGVMVFCSTQRKSFVLQRQWCVNNFGMKGSSKNISKDIFSVTQDDILCIAMHPMATCVATGEVGRKKSNCGMFRSTNMLLTIKDFTLELSCWHGAHRV